MFIHEIKDINLENIIEEIKEKDSILNRRLDVIYIDNSNTKIIQSCQTPQILEDLKIEGQSL